MSNIHQPSEAELDILNIIWEHSPITVRAVHEQLSTKKQVGYTTTLKQMQRMREKGMIKKVENSKPATYQAIAQAEQVQQNLFQKLLNNAFKGSALKLVMHALGNSNTSKEEIEALEDFLKEKKNSNSSSNTSSNSNSNSTDL